MRKLLLILFVFSSLLSEAQSWTPIFGRQRFMSGLGIPVKDTITNTSADSSQLVLRPQNGALYYRYKTSWIQLAASVVNAVDSIWIVSGSPDTLKYRALGITYIGGLIQGGGSIDTTSLSNRINLKLNILDTAAMLSPYLRKIDTTSLKPISASGTGVSLVNGSSNIKRLKAGTGISITDNTDSVTITNSAASIDSGTIALRPVSGTFGQRYYQTDEKAGWYIWNGREWEQEKPYETIFEYTFQTRTYNSAPGITLVGSGGGDFRYDAGYFNQIGASMYNNNFWCYTASATAISGYRTGAGASSENLRLADSFFVFHQRVWLEAISNSTNRYVLRVGSNVNNGTSDGFGFYFKYCDTLNSGQWQVICANGVGTTTVNTGTAVAAQTAYDLVITYQGGNRIEFCVNGVKIATVYTNIASSLYDTGAWLSRTSGTGTVGFFPDRLRIYRF